MKKIFFIIFICIIFTSCVTTKQKENWAKELGYVKPSELTPLEEPTHSILPHPTLPVLSNEDFSKEMLMKEILIMNGSIEKLEYLIEIYEREYVNSTLKYSNEKFKDKSLEELKIEYMNLLGIIKKGEN